MRYTVTKLEFAQDNSFGPTYEYENGQPVRYGAPLYLATATVDANGYSDLLTATVLLTHEETQRIMELVDMATARAIKEVQR